MPIKKSETGKRWVEMELLVPGAPEQVWQAMATGPGNACWFVRGEIEPRVGGAFRLDFGQGMTTAGDVTTWEPPRQFAYVERDWACQAALRLDTARFAISWGRVGRHVSPG